MEKIIAKTESTVYYLKEYSDGSCAVMYNNGYTVGTWAAVDRLKSHLLHLANVKYGTTWDSLIPAEWEILDPEFFKKLAIY